jgi:hypothetical protein
MYRRNTVTGTLLLKRTPLPAYGLDRATPAEPRRRRCHANGETPLHEDHIARRTSMDTQPMTVLEIEAVATLTSSAANANDRSERCPTPETAGRTRTQWLVDAILLGVAAGVTLYGGIWWDPTTFPN